MEHSALHALELTGLVIALGGVFLMLGLVRPAGRSLGADNSDLGRAFSTSAARWIFRGSLMAAVAACLNLLVQVAEVRGKTVFSGVDLSLVATFATQTTVGRLCLARIAALLLTAAFARLSGNGKWWLAGMTGLCAVVLTSSVSHAAAQPIGRFTVVASEIAHITAASVWVGILIQLLAVRTSIEAGTEKSSLALLAEIVRRFSPVALIATTLLGLTGLIMVLRFLGEPDGLVTSAYGLTLIIKMLMLAPAIYAGAVNYRLIRPQLAALAAAGGASDTSSPAPAPGGTPVLRRFGRMLELEVTAGVLVITVAGILASVSPPGQAGSYRLTQAQAHAVLSPRIPDARVIDPATFYGAAQRTADDFRYSEFMHHCSGVFVGLLGLGWLAQSVRGNLGHWAGYIWPFLLIPFALFVAMMSDPEIWVLRRVSVGQAIGDPQLLEHQLGAVMILTLVWLGWRDHRKPPARRPLGYALPIILILGGVLLLGHAHSTLTITEEVTNLINVQHAVFGAFILLAGVVRWFSLRALLPQNIANVAWPSLIIGLGMYMTFCYRETI